MPYFYEYGYCLGGHLLIMAHWSQYKYGWMSNCSTFLLLNIENCQVQKGCIKCQPQKRDWKKKLRDVRPVYSTNCEREGGKGEVGSLALCSLYCPALWFRLLPVSVPFPAACIPLLDWLVPWRCPPHPGLTHTLTSGLFREPAGVVLRTQRALECKFMVLSCKIAPTPHLIKCPQSNCVGINGVAMLIFPNNSAYRQIYCSPWVVFGTDSTLQATIHFSERVRGFGGCGHGSCLWNGTPLSFLVARFDYFGIYADSPFTLVTFVSKLKLFGDFRRRRRRRAKVSLMDLRLELFCWMSSVCDFRVPSSGLAG